MTRARSLLLGSALVLLCCAPLASRAQSAPHNSVTLDWTAPTMYTDGTAIPATETITYTVFAGKSGAEVQVASGVAALSWVSPVEAPGSTVCFQVSAHDVQGNSDSVRTNELCSTIPAEVPGAPLNLKATLN